jgi:hypothetical protein
VPSVIKLINGDKVYATQEPPALAAAAQEHGVIAANVDGKPDVFIVVANIATIAEGKAPSGAASF